MRKWRVTCKRWVCLWMNQRELFCKIGPAPKSIYNWLHCFPSMCHLAEDSCLPPPVPKCWNNLKSGKKRLLGILILWGLLLLLLTVMTIAPHPAVTNPSLIPPTCCSAWSRQRSSNKRLLFAMHQEAWLSMLMGIESLLKWTQTPQPSAWKAKQVALSRWHGTLDGSTWNNSWGNAQCNNQPGRASREEAKSKLAIEHVHCCLSSSWPLACAWISSTLVRHSPLEGIARNAWALEENPYKGVGFLRRGWHQHGGQVVDEDRGS